MEKLIALLLVLFVSQSWALKLELLAQTTVPHRLKFEKTIIGGLSGIYYDADTQILVAVSDDRGRIGEPRFYDFTVKYEKNNLTIEPKAVHFVKKKGQKSYDSILDMEAITVLPWGNYLIASEGDLNHKPRVLPEILDVKKDGTLVRTFEIPEKFLPEKTGKQTKGVQNNLAFEALTKTPDGSKIFMVGEAPLIQQKNHEVAVLTYEMPEAWVIKPTTEYSYKPEEAVVKDQIMNFGGFVSDALALSNEELLILERSGSLIPNKKMIGYVCKIFKAKIEKGKTLLSKEQVFDFDSIKEKLGGTIENFEGLSYGPEVNGKKTLLVISDDNFRKAERTQVLLFSIEEGKK